MIAGYHHHHQQQATFTGSEDIGHRLQNFIHAWIYYLIINICYPKLYFLFITLITSLNQRKNFKLMWKIISILPLIAFTFSISKDEASQPLRFDLVRFSTDGLGQTSWSSLERLGLQRSETARTSTSWGALVSGDRYLKILTVIVQSEKMVFRDPEGTMKPATNSKLIRVSNYYQNMQVEISLGVLWKKFRIPFCSVKSLKYGWLYV